MNQEAKPMEQTKKLSLFEAIFITINVMLGTGAFINTVIITKYTGAFGGFLYPIAGMLMLPLVLAITQLMRTQERSDFYSLGALLNPFFGFVSSWSYFIGKLASATLSIHVFVMFLQHVFPVLSGFSLALDCSIIGTFIYLNSLGAKAGSTLQYGFVMTKLMPLIFVIFAGACCTHACSIASPDIIWAGIPAALPLTLFCFLGFEASCSLSRLIENPKRNAPLAILISFLTVVFLCSWYQFSFYMVIGKTLADQANYTQAFPLLVKLATPRLFTYLNALFAAAIATSALGGAYGILYSNLWNLYTIAEQKHIPFWNTFTLLNNHSIPFWCAVSEGLICIGYLCLSQGAQVPLQYTATLGCLTAYSITTLASFYRTRSFLSAFGIVTCLILFKICLNGFINTGLIPLFILGITISIGSILYYIQHR